MSSSNGSLAALGAKAHVLYSRMLKPEDYWVLLRLESVEEIASYLKQTEAYGSHLDEMLTGKAHRSTLEYAVRTAAMKEQCAFMNYLSGVYRKFYVDYLGLGETATLKNLFRAIHSKKLYDSRKHRKIFRIPGSKLPYDQLTEVRTFGELLDVLEGTRYYNAVKAPINRMMSGENALFSLEQAVDIVAGSDLFADIKKLPADDRALVEPLIGARVDLRNISHAYRMRRYYGMSAEEAISRMLPVRYKVKSSHLRTIMEMGNVEETLKFLCENFPLYGKYFKEAVALQDGDIASENAAGRCVYAKAVSVLRTGTPGFHTAVAYSVLKAFEMDDIVRITEDVRYDYDVRFAAQYLIRPLLDGGEHVWQ